MAAVTRFGLEGYGVRRAGSFANKASTNVHPGVTREVILDRKGRSRVLLDRRGRKRVLVRR